MTDAAQPFGALAPTAVQQRARALAHRLPANYWGRRAASLLLGPAGGRGGRAFDVDVFETQRARLHPYDNICEKRVYLTPQLWDGEERAAIADYIAASPHREILFADVGANAGLYALFARAAAQRAGKALRAWCIEPDPVMLSRLAFNMEASDASNDVAILPFAAGAEAGTLRLDVNAKSRGLTKVDEAGAVEIAARPLAEMLADAPRIDIMKIDIEGYELPVLEAFYRDAPTPLRPSLVVIEKSHETAGASASGLVESLGYRRRIETRLNLVLEKAAQPA